MQTIVLGGAALAAALIAATVPSKAANKESFQAMLTGSAEVPPVVTQAEGKANFTLTGDTVTYSITAKGLTGVVAAHVHIGALGKTGAPAVTLYSGPKTNVTSGALVHGTFTAKDVHGVTFLELISDMKKGDAYVNVHTSAHPGGELRGQINAVESMKTSSR